MAQTLWSSARLVYRGVENDDEDFLEDLNVDPVSWINAAPLLPTPRSKKTAVEFREFLHGNDKLLSAIICIPLTQEEKEAALAAQANGTNTDKEKNKKSKPTSIGIITLTCPQILAHHHRAEVGIHLLPKYQGQGYGSEAIQWALRWGFRRANLHRISIGTWSFNTGAVRLYKRLGFVLEGQSRDAFWHDGAYYDVLSLGMLENEWRERYGKDA